MVEQGAAPRPHQVAEYRPDTDAWTLLPPSTVGFWDPCWFFTDGRLVIVSQDARAGRTGLARPVGGQLDLTTGRWSSVPQVTPAFLAGAGCPLPRLGVGPEWIGGGGSVLVSLEPAATAHVANCADLAEPQVGAWVGADIVIWGGPDATMGGT